MRGHAEREQEMGGGGREGQVAKEVTLETGRALQEGGPVSTKALGSK